MPSSFNDFIGSFIGLVGVKQRQEQIAQEQRNAQVQGISTFLNAARETANPQDHVALVQRFAQLGIADPASLTSMLNVVTPTLEAQKAAKTREGVGVIAKGGQPATAGENLAANVASQNLAGMDISGLDEAKIIQGIMQSTTLTPDQKTAALTQRLAKALPGTVARSAGQEALGPTGNKQAAAIEGGLALSAGQQQQGQQFNKTFQFNAEQAMREYGLSGQRLSQDIIHMREMEAQGRAGLGLEQQRIMASAAASPHIAQLLETKAGIIKSLEGIKNPTPGLIGSYIGELNGINATLRAANVPVENPIPYDPNAMVDPSWWRGVKERYLLPAQPIIGGTTGAAPPPSSTLDLSKTGFNPWLY